MREDLLHFIWKYKKLPIGGLATSEGEEVVIDDVGTHNHLAGPDFFNAKIHIGQQLWAGNVEIHVKSSDWYAHHHEQDPKYNNVILHVVWEDDAQVFRSDGSHIPILELKEYIPHHVLKAYRDLLHNKQVRFINCERHIAQTDQLVLDSWIERLFFERLERKSEVVFQLLEESKNDWEKVLFALLMKSFGLNINGEAFLSLAKALDFSVVRKVRDNLLQLECVFFGLAQLIDNEDVQDEYYIRLRKEFGYLKNKFELSATGVLRPDFFKLRPANFPTVRLSQIANLYHVHQNLFSKIIDANQLDDLYAIFDVSASAYWNGHFTFGKPVSERTKKLTKNFIDLLILNAILPLKFCHARYLNYGANTDIVAIASSIGKEKNSIISNFKGQGVLARNAMESQGLLQLYNTYCSKNRCVQCAVGARLLDGNS